MSYYVMAEWEHVGSDGLHVFLFARPYQSGGPAFVSIVSLFLQDDTAHTEGNCLQQGVR